MGLAKPAVSMTARQRRQLFDLPASSSAKALILVVRRWYVELRICRVAKGSLQWASYPALTCMTHAPSAGQQYLLSVTIEKPLHCSGASAQVQHGHLQTGLYYLGNGFVCWST